MHIRLFPSRWLGRIVTIAALMPALIHCGLAAAQTASSDLSAGKYYNKEASFGLPIKIDASSRNAIKEVQLWMKLPGGEWQFKDKAQPFESSFRFKAPADGEYWFTLVTIGAKGEASPDLNHLPLRDIVMVVVDTQPPAFELQPIKLVNGDLLLRCSVSDANPDLKSLKISYQGPDQMIRTLEPMPGQPGTFRVHNPDIFANPMRVVVADLAGNVTTKVMNLQDSVAKVMAPPTNVAGGTGQALQGPGGLQQAGIVVPNPIGPGILKDAPTQPITANNQVIDPKPVTVPNPPSANPAVTGSIQKQLINTTRASLEYRVDQKGSSGVGKVDVYMTADQGTSWKRLCEDADRTSPAEFDLPGDGLFGVRVVLTNGNGFGGRAPAPGEQPQLWIEVDTIAPSVQLKEIEPPTSGGTLDIRWQVSDKNLGHDAITLSYATRREGPWQPIARALKNDGVYHWAFPRDVGSQFFIRLEAVDQAGNVAKCDSPNAVVLDMTEPRASVIGVTGVQPGSQVKGN